MRFNKYIIGVVIFIIIIISGIGFYLFQGLNPEDNMFDPVIIKETENPIVGEEIYLKVDQIPSGSNISWVIDDNTTKYGMKISIIYYISDEYQILCIVKNDGKEVVRNTSISVNNPDNYDVHTNIMLVSTPRGPTWDVEGSDIYPGISQPSVRIKISIQKVIGTLGIQILFNQNEEGGEIIYEENHNCMNEDIEFDNDFSYPTLPEIIYESHIQAQIRLDNGKTGAYQIEIWVTY